jgi:two-component system osmolarity sensor histidine kinase EnvZ
VTSVPGERPGTAAGLWRRSAQRLRRVRSPLPKGLYTRSLLIVILPIVLLQAVVTSVFLERHWDRVTHALSGAVAQDVGTVIELYRNAATDGQRQAIISLAARRLSLAVSPEPRRPVPAEPPAGGGLFSLLDQALTEEIRMRVNEPFWVDTSDPNQFAVHVELPDTGLRILGRQSLAYASNSHIFLVWMVTTAVVLIAVAILFLRNQIRPILQLADAAESLGKGRDVPDFRPRGAREVRRASAAFLAMKERIERQIEQRTAMLAGVSHDLRTVLTRFKLELALLGDGPEVREISADVDEMSRMLEGYLAFARGDAGEAAREVDIAALIGEVAGDVRDPGCRVETALSGEPTVTARPDALKRCLGNLVLNAARFANRIRITARHGGGELVVDVEDDGPGIAPEHREEVFRPFLRLDQARNLDHAGSGLGLTIARDVARSHGGDLTLGESALGGLRATLRIPA